MAREVSRRIAALPQSSTALTIHSMDGKSLPPARYIVIEPHPEGLYLFRYSETWQFGGDTWHQSLDDVNSQIDFEFGTGKLDWRVISEAELVTLTK